MIRLLTDQVLLRHEVTPESRRIVTPDGWDTQMGRSALKGVILAIGPGRRTKKGIRVPMSVKPGDAVLFYGLEEMTWPGWVAARPKDWPKDQVIVSERHIQAVIG